MYRYELKMKTETVLCIDIGNTHLKWGVCRFNDIVFSQTGIMDSEKEMMLQDLDASFSAIKSQPVWISSVASSQLKQCVSDWVEKNWGFTVSDVDAGLKYYKNLNNYKKVSTLGVDRWLAMVAAQHRLKNNFCVIDAGTAITIDVVDATGDHAGGVIMPGEQLMFSSLLGGTSRIGSVVGEDVGLADNTADGVRSGVVSCLVGGVDRVLSDVSKKNKNIQFIITGGSAEFLKSLLSYKMTYEKNLVLEGVGLVARNAYA
jgi:type III pantothenate kinase